MDAPPETPAPAPLPAKKKKSRRIFYAILVPVVLLLAAIAVPNYVKSRTTACKNACINNLRQIDGAKEQYALEHKKSAGYHLTDQDIVTLYGYIKGGEPKCPDGGHFTIGLIDAAPTCSVAGHSL